MEVEHCVTLKIGEAGSEPIEIGSFTARLRFNVTQEDGAVRFVLDRGHLSRQIAGALEACAADLRHDADEMRYAD